MNKVGAIALFQLCLSREKPLYFGHELFTDIFDDESELRALCDVLDMSYGKLHPSDEWWICDGYHE